MRCWPGPRCNCRHPCHCRRRPPPPAGLHQALDAVPAAAVLRAEPLIGSGRPGGVRDAAAAGPRRHRRRARPAGCRPRPAGACRGTDGGPAAARARRLGARPARAAADPGGARPAAGCRPAGPAPSRCYPWPLAADPGFADLRRRLAERALGLALEGLEAATLGLLDPRHLPADLLLLRWSPALAAAGPAAALAGFDPARLLLVGAQDAAALEFAQAAGLLLARDARCPPA